MFRPPSPSAFVRVVIPARDEASTITSALDALRLQVDCCGYPLEPDSYEVTVLANNCQDATADVVREYGTRYPTFRLRVRDQQFPPDRANIGTARRTLMDEACERFEPEGRDGIVASTDADTCVAPDWIASTLRAFENGAEAVGGRILLSSESLERLDPTLRALYLRDTGYRILIANLEARVDPVLFNPYPRHHQFFGASMAVRCSVYRRAGGIPTVETLEDMAFFRALTGIDARVRHSPSVRVTTSGRLDGRVELGLSTQLGEWAEAARNGIPRIEEPVARSLKRMELVRDRRCAWMRQGPFAGFETFGSYLHSVETEIEEQVQAAVPYVPVLLEQVIQDARVESARRSNRSSRYVSSR